MKKVGIVSMQRVPNYGSFLQAYALSHIISELGYEVEFIDYKYGTPIVPYSKWKYFIFRIKNIPFIAFMLDFFRVYVFRERKFAYLYRLKYLSLLNIGYKHTYHKPIDSLVIGSDEVFNCTQNALNVGFSPMLFGKGLSSKRIISYAASFGYTTFAQLEKYKLVSTVKAYIKNFDAISVRDQNSYDIINNFNLEKEINVNLDPVFMYDFTLSTSYKHFAERYAIIYTYTSRVYSKEEQDIILKFCQTHELALFTIGDALPWVPNSIEAAPVEALEWIKKAEFIITDTFHGTVFSIKYNKNFAVMVREDNKNKLQDLLIRLKQESRIISEYGMLDEMYATIPDYSITNEIIKKEKVLCRNYLKKNLC